MFLSWLPAWCVGPMPETLFWRAPWEVHSNPVNASWSRQQKAKYRLAQWPLLHAEWPAALLGQ